MAIILHRKTLKTPLIEMSGPDGPMSSVPSLGMGQRHPTHKLRQITIITGPQKQMPVIAHDTVSANTHPDPLNTLSQNLLKSQKIGVLTKYPQSTIGPVKNVINVSTQCYSISSRHIHDYKPKNEAQQEKMYRTFLFRLAGPNRAKTGLKLVNNAPYQTGIFDHDHSWPAVLWPYYGDTKLLCCPTARKKPHRVGRYDNDEGMFSTWAVWTDYQRDFIYGS